MARTKAAGKVRATKEEARQSQGKVEGLPADCSVVACLLKANSEGARQAPLGKVLQALIQRLPRG